MFLEYNMYERAKIHFDNGSIFLDEDSQWVPSNESTVLQARIANIMTKPLFREYTPSCGYYDVFLAYKISEKMGGKVEVPKRDVTSKKELVY